MDLRFGAVSMQQVVVLFIDRSVAIIVIIFQVLCRQKVSRRNDRQSYS